MNHYRFAFCCIIYCRIWFGYSYSSSWNGPGGLSRLRAGFNYYISQSGRLFGLGRNYGFRNVSRSLLGHSSRTWSMSPFRCIRFRMSSPSHYGHSFRQSR